MFALFFVNYCKSKIFSKVGQRVGYWDKTKVKEWDYINNISSSFGSSVTYKHEKQFSMLEISNAELFKNKQFSIAIFNAWNKTLSIIEIINSQNAHLLK